MAVECSLSVLVAWSVDMASYLRDNRGSEGNVGHKMTVHDINLAARDLELASSSHAVFQNLHTWSQSAPLPIVSEHSFPSFAKSADRIDGAIIAGGDIFRESIGKYADYSMKK